MGFKNLIKNIVNAKILINEALNKVRKTAKKYEELKKLDESLKEEDREIKKIVEQEKSLVKSKNIRKKYDLNENANERLENIKSSTIRNKNKGVLIVDEKSSKGLVKRKNLLNTTKETSIDKKIKSKKLKVDDKDKCFLKVRYYSELYVEGLIGLFNTGIQRNRRGIKVGYSNVTRYIFSPYQGRNFKLFIAGDSSPFLNRDEAFILKHYKTKSVFKVSRKKYYFYNRATGDYRAFTPFNLLTMNSKDRVLTNSKAKRKFFAIRFNEFIRENEGVSKKVSKKIVLKKSYLNDVGSYGISVYKRKPVFEDYTKWFLKKYSKNKDFKECIEVDVLDNDLVVVFKPKLNKI
jgi:hypothetical protein